MLRDIESVFGDAKYILQFHKKNIKSKIFRSKPFISNYDENKHYNWKLILHLYGPFVRWLCSVTIDFIFSNSENVRFFTRSWDVMQNLLFCPAESE